MSGEDVKQVGSKWGWLVAFVISGCGWVYTLGAQHEQVQTVIKTQTQMRSEISHLQSRDHQLTEVLTEMRHIRQAIERLERRDEP